MQSFIILASLVFELAGEVKMTPLVLNVTKNTLVLQGLTVFSGVRAKKWRRNTVKRVLQWRPTTSSKNNHSSSTVHTLFSLQVVQAKITNKSCLNSCQKSKDKFCTASSCVRNSQRINFDSYPFQNCDFIDLPVMISSNKDSNVNFLNSKILPNSLSFQICTHGHP